VTGQTIQERSFYKRFSPGLVRLLKMLLSRAFEECIGVGRSLKGPLAAAVRPLRDVRILLRELDRFLLHEAVDPNAGRQGLLVSVEGRTHRLHRSAAAA
jgi:hypothetical protein